MDRSHIDRARIRGGFAWPAALALVGWLAWGSGPAASDSALPAPVEGDYTAHDFHFGNGTSMPELRLHYTALGTPKRDASGRVTNAVLLLHGTTGTGRQFLTPATAEPLFGPGKPLDASKFYLVMPDGIGAGGSSKPSDGLKSRFPHYGYKDQVEAQRLLLKEGLGIDHLALVFGTSMGGMQAWFWAERNPTMMDGVVAIAATPAGIGGRNMMWRDMIVQAIRTDPDWHGGDYTVEPTRWRAILPLFAIMTGNDERLQRQAPSREAAIDLDKSIVAAGAKIDADDYLASFESSADYDPSGELDRIAAPLLAINFGDDLLNPADLGLTEAAIKHVAHGTSVLIPASEKTFGHQTLGHPEIWGDKLAEFMKTLPAKP